MSTALAFSAAKYPRAFGSYAAQASHIAADRSKRSRAWAGAVTPPARSACTAVVSQSLATECRCAPEREQPTTTGTGDAGVLTGRRGGEAISTIRSARTPDKRLSPPHAYRTITALTRVAVPRPK